MFRTMLGGALGVAVFLALPGLALAQANRLTLVVGGEAYDGPPKFEVLFGGHRIGEGTVAAAIDTANAGRFANSPVKSAYIQSFEFEIPDAVFSVSGDVRIKFLNEAYGGDGSNRDRNLFVSSVSVNGVRLPGTAFTSVSASGTVPSAILGEYFVIVDGTADGLARSPAEGWPAAGTDVAAVEPEIATPEIEEPVAPVPPPISARPVVAKPALAVKVPELPETTVADPEPADVPVDVANLDQNPEIEQRCGLDQLYNVIGFNENSNELTPRLMERLDQIVADIGEHECVISVVGYSSTLGDYATNALFAVERAQNVLRYLRQKGLNFSETSATGAGETEQFGPLFSDNRRVVITVAP